MVVKCLMHKSDSTILDSWDPHRKPDVVVCICNPWRDGRQEQDNNLDAQGTAGLV